MLSTILSESDDREFILEQLYFREGDTCVLKLVAFWLLLFSIGYISLKLRSLML